MAGKIIYGGSFNPVHVGHLRLAIETFEMLGNFVDSLEFVPSGRHPWKEEAGMLPIAMRSRMIRESIASMPSMRCNELESQRSGPSYTIDTIKAYCKTLLPAELFFLVGSADYALLPKWRNGLDMPLYCNLVVAPRGGYGVAEFIAMTQAFWPLARLDEKGAGRIRLAGKNCACMMLPEGTGIFYLPAPYLEVSASRIRKLWLDGRDIRYLVPEAVIEFLESQRHVIMEYWRENDTQCST